jgi:arginase
MSIRTVKIIGVPSDLGAGRRGVDMGPSAIRYGRLAEEIDGLGLTCEDFGNIEVALAERSQFGREDLRHLETVLDNCTKLRDVVMQTLSENKFPLILGGDHSLSIGSVSAICEAWENPGVLWIDAHADFNTHETTPSGNIHGMSLAVSAGIGAPELTGLYANGNFIDPSRIALIGARSIDVQERDLLKESGVAVFTMHDIDERGMRRVLDEALRQVSAGTDGLHVSFDMDVLDPSFAPGVGTPVAGGISYRESHLVMEMIAQSGLMKSLEIVEVNPILDDRNKTARLAVELIASALGREIF